MTVRHHPLSIAASVAVLLVGACFDGDATVGAICGEPNDCGPDQGCRHELCGRCGDGAHAPREVCYADPLAVDAAGAVAAMRVADLDDDGRDDVVVVDTDGSAAVLLGSGGAPVRTELAAPIVATHVAVGDLDDDDDLDLAFAGGTELAIARNDGAAGFVFDADLLTLGDAPRELGVLPAGGGQPARVLVAGSIGSLWWQPATAGSIATELAVGTDVHLGPQLYWDDDELGDTAIVDHRSYRLSIVRGTADGFSLATSTEVGRGPVAAVGFDRTGDGRVDFLTLDREGHSVTLVDSTPKGGLVPFDTLAFEREPQAITAVDADLDGRLDILVGTDERLELWRAIGGNYPEGVLLRATDVALLDVAGLSPTPLLDVLLVRGTTLQRLAVDP